MTREQAINYLISSGFSEEQVSEVVRALTYDPTTKNDLGVDCIDRAELLKAMDTWDKFGYTETGCFVRAPKNDYVPYVHYEDMVNCVKGMPSVTSQEPCYKCEVGNPCLYCKHEFEAKTGHWIDDEFGSKCSCCGIHTHLDKFDRPMKFKYCSMCGAKMVEPQESEE